jgi:TnpA family transposase
MIYWHVERKSLYIHSQLKSPSSSEVAAMIEGVIRHCTEMSIDRQYVDSHGQGEVAYAFCHLLGFQLLPRRVPLKRNLSRRSALASCRSSVHLYSFGLAEGPASSHRLRRLPPPAND